MLVAYLISSGLNINLIVKLSILVLKAHFNNRAKNNWHQMKTKQNLFNQAFQLHQSGQIREAIKLYTKVLSKQGNNAQLLYFLGTAHLQIHQHSQALKQLQRSLAIDPDNSFAYNNLGNAFRDLKRLSEALQAYDQALRLSPDYAEAYYNRGNTLQDLHRLDEALDSYDKALALKHDFPEARDSRNHTLGKLQRPEETPNNTSAEKPTAKPSVTQEIVSASDAPTTDSKAKIRVFDFLVLDEPIQVMDVGASAIAEVPVYKSLLNQGFAHLNAFEGDARQIESIERAYGKQSTIYKDFLFDGTEKTLYVASGPSGMTSLLKPRTTALKFFNGFEFFGTIEKTEQVQTRTLDSIHNLPLIDFLKMDIQGAELTVLKNGVKKLKNCLAVQLEVSYICLYEDQPAFGDIDVWMRSQGYVPHCFLDVKRWSIAPTIFNNNFRIAGNQLLESDIVYIKDPLKLEQLNQVQLIKFAALAHHCFKSYDLCVFILLELERRNLVELNTHARYLTEIGKKTP